MDALVYSVLGLRNSQPRPASALLARALECAAAEDWPAAYDALQVAIGNRADARAGHFMLWEVCQILGHKEVALANLLAALRDNPVTSRYCAAPRRRILVLAVPGDFQANLPIDELLGPPDNELHTLWLVDPGRVMNELVAVVAKCRVNFDCVFIAIAEDVRHRSALAAADRLAEALKLPTINSGHRIAAVSRQGAARLLHDLPDAVVPRQTEAGRTMLTAGASLEFPSIIRTVGSHAGKDLARIDDPPALAAYLARVTADRFYIAPFVDYQSNDWLWRKYRVILVDGSPFPCHLAIHDDWAVWYYNARMDLDANKRLEESRFLRDIGTVFPERAMGALQAIAGRIGLDYCGVDCGLMPDGRLVVFEIETGMIVHDWDPPEIYPYKREAAQAIRQATETMIDRRLAASVASHHGGPFDPQDRMLLPG